MTDTASSGKKPSAPLCIEGRDYTVRSDGAWVFSREYLLARGTCCASKCLNCPYEYSRESLDVAKMRPIVSMVPSWTETLIAARLNVVGRTRFCIHPADAVQDILSLGGTKTLATSAAETMAAICEASALRPIVILDREENPREYAEFFAKFSCEIIVSHIENFPTLARDLRLIAVKLADGAPDDAEGARTLRRYAERTEALVAQGMAPARSLGSSLLKSRETPADLDRALANGVARSAYLIWKNPWMEVTSETWIGHVLERLFPQIRLPPSNGGSKYPEVDLKNVAPGANLLFSSEPFPFLREWNALIESDEVKSAKSAAVVDGESLSWFGLRAIRFLEEASFQVESSTSDDR